MFNAQELAIPEVRIAAAQDIILKIIPSFDKSNVLGLAIFGSFWDPQIKRKPSDLDLAIYARNESEFIDKDKSSLVQPLTQAFKLEVEPRILTPYTPVVTHEVENYRKILKDAVILWGKMPSWIK